MQKLVAVKKSQHVGERDASHESCSFSSCRGQETRNEMHSGENISIRNLLAYTKSHFSLSWCTISSQDMADNSSGWVICNSRKAVPVGTGELLVDFLERRVVFLKIRLRENCILIMMFKFGYVRRHHLQTEQLRIGSMIWLDWVLSRVWIRVWGGIPQYCKDRQLMFMSALRYFLRTFFGCPWILAKWNGQLEC